MDEQEKKVTQAVILHYNEDGEVSIGVQGGVFHPQEIVSMCEVAKAKLELMMVREAVQAEQHRGVGRIVSPDGERLF